MSEKSKVKSRVKTRVHQADKSHDELSNDNELKITPSGNKFPVRKVRDYSAYLANQDENNEKKNLVSKYKFHMVKFNKIWSEVQQKQELVRSTYDSLRKLQSMIVAQDIPVPRPVPAFRVIEFIDGKESICEFSRGSTYSTCSTSSFMQDELINKLKLLKDENLELSISLEVMKKQLEQGETKRKILLRKVSTQTEVLSNELRGKHECSVSTDMSYTVDNECQTEDISLMNSGSEVLKELLDRSEERCNALKTKLIEVHSEVANIKNEQLKVTDTCISLDFMESHTQVELFELSRENKESQTCFENDFLKKLQSYLYSLDIEDNKKSLLATALNQFGTTDRIVQHIKVIYDEYATTYRCSKDLEKRIRYLEREYIDVTKGKEKLEKRIQKLSEICKAFQGLNEVQEKEIRHYHETKTQLNEKNQKCEYLTKRVADLETVINKIKDRKNIFKKKYFKERHANRKKNKKKHENWLSKIFDWRQIADLKV